jgi:5,10-methylene-tetrahydrofolate dehydrogenase/methenyl tetrahydrofolate cyclohydrolase
MRRGATVMTFNSHSNQNWMKNCCLNSDIIISCTGVVHLIDETFVRNDQSQVVIDVGR